MEKLFFDSWESIVRTTVITILAYIALIAMLRISGKRTLSKMNAFDFVITIAIGSSYATLALNKNVALADGVVVFGLFILMQYLISLMSVRKYKFKQLVTSKPALLLYKGEVLTNVLKKERITLDEIKVAAREKGISSLTDVDFIVLETTGDITVVSEAGDKTDAVKNVEGYS